MNIKQRFAYAVPQAPVLLWLVDAWPMAAGKGGVRGGDKEGEQEREGEEQVEREGSDKER